MKPKILYYDSNKAGSFLIIQKNGFVIDIACSNKNLRMFSKILQPKNSQLNPFSKSNDWDNVIEVQVQDLALYTHWPVHTKEFWDLLDET